MAESATAHHQRAAGERSGSGEGKGGDRVVGGEGQVGGRAGVGRALGPGAGRGRRGRLGRRCLAGRRDDGESGPPRWRRRHERRLLRASSSSSGLGCRQGCRHCCCSPRLPLGSCFASVLDPRSLLPLGHLPWPTMTAGPTRSPGDGPGGRGGPPTANTHPTLPFSGGRGLGRPRRGAVASEKAP